MKGRLRKREECFYSCPRMGNYERSDADSKESVRGVKLHVVSPDLCGSIRRYRIVAMRSKSVIGEDIEQKVTKVTKEE